MIEEDMKFYRLLTTLLLVILFVSTSCSKESVQTPSAGALTANSAFNNLAARPFGRHNLNASGFHILNEFIKPDIRSRIDEEPVGDSDSGYDPSTVDPGASAEQAQTENAPESQNEESQPNQADSGELNPAEPQSDSFKFSWAKKSFGDAIKANPSTNGVIVLYADENFYEVERLMGFIEEGRGRIAFSSGIGSERIQVVFGGYRAVPQIELWVLPDGVPMPEFKTEARPKPNQSEN
jgi:hypothetical protein